MKKLVMLFTVVAMVTLTFNSYADVGKVKSHPSIAQAQSQSPGCTVVALNEATNIEAESVIEGNNTDLNSSTVAFIGIGSTEVNSSNLIINTEATYTGNDYRMVMLLTKKDKLQMVNNSSGTYPYNFSLKTEAQQNLAMVNTMLEELAIKKIDANTTEVKDLATASAIPGEVVLISTNTALMV